MFSIFFVSFFPCHMSQKILVSFKLSCVVVSLVRIHVHVYHIILDEHLFYTFARIIETDHLLNNDHVLAVHVLPHCVQIIINSP